MTKVRWGILGTARIARAVIRGLRAGGSSEVTAVASRDEARARAMAQELGIPRAYGSYEELLADRDVDAVYNPLPNHLHVPWSKRALSAGKHVLCEKPLALDAAQAEELLVHARQFPGLQVMEAFMYRFHPQWQRVRELVDGGDLGRLQLVRSFFSFHNVQPHDIRNRPEVGGGGLLDIGCYCISVARYIWAEEPLRVSGSVEFDPQFGTDRLASAVLEFPRGQATFSCGTQLNGFQRVELIGSEGRLEVEQPFSNPPDAPLRLLLERPGGKEELSVPAADQYALQGEEFARSVLSGTSLSTPLEDAVANMRTIDAVFESARSGRAVQLR